MCNDQQRATRPVVSVCRCLKRFSVFGDESEADEGREIQSPPGDIRGEKDQCVATSY